MLIGFPPVFVVDPKIIYGHNFVAPLTKASANLLHYILESFIKLDCVNDVVRKSPISKIEVLDYILKIEKLIIPIHFCVQIMKLYC